MLDQKKDSFAMIRLNVFAWMICFAMASTATAVDVGDAAPKFEAPDDTGSMWKSSEHVGKKILVVYFYPADMTGGCTAQACGYRDKMEQFSADGVQVVGVSGDSVKNHQVFKKAHQLNFPLLADSDGSVAKAFGVPVALGERSVTKLFEGKETNLLRTATAKRWTFVIDRDGKVVHKDASVKARQDPAKVEAVIAKIQ